MPTEQLLNVTEAAARLGIDEDVLRARLRDGIPGARRLRNGSWKIPASALEQQAKPTGRRGPSRPLTLEPGPREQLVRQAKAAGERIEEHRAGMAAAAADRQNAILALNVGGLSVRQIADELGISAAPVQAALKEARGRLGGSPDRS